MTRTDKVQTSYRGHPDLEAYLFISSIQYFVIQFFVATRFTPQYSLVRNTISDLGNSSCGVFGGHSLCSPLHTLMNASFLYLGLTMIAGSLLLCGIFRRHNVSIGFSLFAAAGVGVMVVGLFPENTISILHGIGAALPFLVGNIGVFVLGYALPIPKSLKIYTMITGIVALGGLGFYISHQYLGLGHGGMERVVAYPQTIWMIVFGLYVLKVKYLGKA